MSVEPYDFRKPTPLPPALSTQLEGWLRDFNRRGPKHWSQHVDLAIEAGYQALKLVPAEEYLAGLLESSLRFRIGLGESNGSALLVVPRPLLLALVGALLADAVDGPIADRELTGIEDSLVEHIIRKFFLDLIEDTYPRKGALALDLQREPAGARGTFARELRFAVLSSQFRGVFGEHDWHLALPRGSWLEGLVQAGGTQTAKAPPSPAELQRLVKELPVRVTVRLGTVDLSLLQVANLEAGDVVLLEQKVTEPLTTLLGEQVKLQVWSGAVGARQAIEVHTLAEP